MGTPEDLDYLAGNVGWLAHQTYALAAFDELTQVTVIVENTIRQPPPAFWYAGPCDHCRRDLYARYGMPDVICLSCNLVYDVEDRRAWLLSVVEDRLERAVTICRALSGLGHEISRHRLGMWVSRGLLVAKGHDARGYPLFRVGDVLDLLERAQKPA